MSTLKIAIALALCAAALCAPQNVGSLTPKDDVQPEMDTLIKTMNTMMSGKAPNAHGEAPDVANLIGMLTNALTASAGDGKAADGKADLEQFDPTQMLGTMLGFLGGQDGPGGGLDPSKLLATFLSQVDGGDKMLEAVNGTNANHAGIITHLAENLMNMAGGAEVVDTHVQDIIQTTFGNRTVLEDFIGEDGPFSKLFENEKLKTLSKEMLEHPERMLGELIKMQTQGPQAVMDGPLKDFLGPGGIMDEHSDISKQIAEAFTDDKLAEFGKQALAGVKEATKDDPVLSSLMDIAMRITSNEAPAPDQVMKALEDPADMHKLMDSFGGVEGLAKLGEAIGLNDMLDAVGGVDGLRNAFMEGAKAFAEESAKRRKLGREL